MSDDVESPTRSPFYSSPPVHGGSGSGEGGDRQRMQLDVTKQPRLRFFMRHGPSPFPLPRPAGERVKKEGPSMGIEADRIVALGRPLRAPACSAVAAAGSHSAAARAL